MLSPYTRIKLSCSLILLVIYIISGYFYFQKMGPSFDEPHYLLSAYSIIYDHDLDLKNNYQEKNYKEFYKGNLDPHVSLHSVKGKWYSIHGYGLPIIIVPFYLLGKAVGTGLGGIYIGILIGISMALILITLISFNLSASALYNLAHSDLELYTGLALLSIFYAINPILVYTKFLSTECIAFLYMCYIIWVLSKREFYLQAKVCLWPLLLGAFFGGLLLWVHVKYSILVFGSMICMVLAYRKALSLSAFFYISVLCLVPVIGLSLFQRLHYGSFSLDAQYPHGSLTPTYLAQSLLGIFLDGHTGILFCSPLYCLLVIFLISYKFYIKDTRNLLLFWILVVCGIPLAVVSGMHVIKADVLLPEESLNYDFVRAWFVDYNEIPMWFQTPVSRFLYPVIPVMTLLISRNFYKIIQSYNNSIFIISFCFLVISSAALSYWQVCFVPHTLFRPNADFESFAPVWGLFLKQYFWVVPNLLSFLFPAENILLSLFWGGLILAFFCFCSKKIFSMAIFLFAGVICFLWASTHIEPYGKKIEVAPMRMSTNCAPPACLSKADKNTRIIHAEQKISMDLIYGPYIYLPWGSYCAKINAMIVGSYDHLKWYISDAFEDHVFSMEETFRPLSSPKFNKTLCFFNDTPHYPKEFKVYVKGFSGSFVLKGVTFKRTNN